jgi:predicted GNAT family acetyltransferase
MTNQLGSIATAAAAGEVNDVELWLTVVDDDGVVVGCAVTAMGRPAVLSPMSVAAAMAIGRFLASHANAVRAVTGPREVAQSVAEGRGATPVLGMREVVRVLSTLRAPPHCPGTARLAVLADLDLLHGWFSAFAIEAGLPVATDPALVSARITDGRLWLWESATGVTTAMGGHARIVATPGGTVGRIGPVYTAPAERRRGYGSAITQVLATELIGECDQVMLYADADNPVSNSVYEKLGFARAGEVVEFKLDLRSR